MRNRFLWVLALLCLLGTGVRGQEEVPDAQPGATPWADPESVTGALREQITTGGSYSAASGGGTRIVNDLHVPDALGSYGLDFTRYWNSLHNEETDLAAQWPTDFGPSGWSHSWRWNAVYDEQPAEMENNPPPHTSFTSITITFPDGHATKFKVARTNANGTLPRVGPQYVGEHETTLWPKAGLAVHDRVAKMLPDGSEFWLYRADGGAVRFVGVDPQYNTGHAWWHYQATEVYDPYGFRTDLIYEDGRLKRVEQEGGRSLILTWSGYVITKVQTGGFAAGQQVNYYYYSKFHPFGAGNLAQVQYQNEPVMGQTTSAYYVYSRAFGDDPNGPLSDSPILKRADDPHFAGAMTKIRYAYRGDFCPVPFWPEDHPPEHFYSRYYFTGHAISEERSGESGTTGTMVSKFYSTCAGERSEENGIGGRRTFYFGDLANDDEVDTIFGYQLTKVTDFGLGNESRPFRKQAGGSQPGIVWDGRDIDTHFQYLDESGSPTQAIYKDGSSCLYDRTNQTPPVVTPDPRIHNKQRHWLFSKKDENGNFTTYTRDSRRRVTHIAYYHGPVQGAPVASESYTYNDWNQVETHTLPSGAVQTYEYNALHQLVRESNNINEEQKEYAYDTLGRVRTMRDARAINDGAEYTEKMEYNGRHLVTKIHYRQTGPNQDPTVTYEYDRYGNRTAVINELGHRKDYTYDSYRRCTSMTEQLNAPGWDGNGIVSSRRWDWIYDRVIDGGVGYRLASAHTGKEWRVQIEPAFNAAGQRRMTARTFDVNNRITTEQTGWIQPPGPIGPNNPWFQGPDIETHSYTYDTNGQKERYKDPRDRITTYEYNNRNRLQKTTEPKREDQAEYPVTRIDYDYAGNKTKVTFPDTKTQRWEDYDPFGQAWKSFDEYERPTDLIYLWGPMKKLSKVTAHRDSENQVTEFTYDEMGRPKKTIFPDASIEENTYRLEQIDTFKTRRNQTKRLHYDARGREDSHTWDGGAAPGITRVWDDASRLTSIANVWSTVDYGYDDAGQVKWEGNHIAGTERRVTEYSRFPSGEVSRLKYPNGNTIVNRRYTARGQLQRAEWTGGYVDYAYLADGKVDFENYGNGVQSDLDYDGRGFIKMSKTHRLSGGQTYAKRDYWRDNRDRIKGWKKGNDVSANPLENGRGDRYDYDYEGQLTGASYQLEDPVNNPVGAQRTDEFAYDALGNRTWWNTMGNRGEMEFVRRENNRLNQYHSWSNSYQPPQHWGSGMFYDDNVPPPSPVPENYPYVFPGNGVLMQDGWITGGFNALNQPVGIWSFAYWSTPNWMFFGHDPLGRCVKRWVGPHVDGHVPPPDTNPATATYLYYDGWNLIQEGPSGSLDRVYVHGNRVDEIVASWSAAGGSWLYHHYDARGHCILQTNASGGLQEQYDYDAFGWPYFYTALGQPARVNGKPGSPSGNRFLFTGREWIKDLRLYDFRNRMYQPELGRFLQPDPTGFEGGDYNLYRYCDNDPVNNGDPTGLATDFMWDFARHGDSANTSQGTFAEFTHGAYMGDTGGGGRRYTMAGQTKIGPANGGNEANIETGRRILAQQTKEGEDSTGSMKDGKIAPGDRIRGKQVPYRFGKPVYAPSGNSVLAARKILYIAEPVPPGRSDLLFHYHSRTGFTSQRLSLAEPTSYDMDALTTTKAMLFSNPYLKAEGSYRIYRNGVPGYETRHDLYDP